MGQSVRWHSRRFRHRPGCPATRRFRNRRQCHPGRWHRSQPDGILQKRLCKSLIHFQFFLNVATGRHLKKRHSPDVVNIPSQPLGQKQKFRFFPYGEILRKKKIPSFANVGRHFRIFVKEGVAREEKKDEKQKSFLYGPVLTCLILHVYRVMRCFGTAECVTGTLFFWYLKKKKKILDLWRVERVRLYDPSFKTKNPTSR